MKRRHAAGFPENSPRQVFFFAWWSGMDNSALVVWLGKDGHAGNTVQGGKAGKDEHAGNTVQGGKAGKAGKTSKTGHEGLGGSGRSIGARRDKAG